jgi:hypothetical protein
MGSISILLIKQFGWRSTYGILGLVSAFTSFLIFLFIKEPERGRFLSEKEKQKEKKQDKNE